MLSWYLIFIFINTSITNHQHRHNCSVPHCKIGKRPLNHPNICTARLFLVTNHDFIEPPKLQWQRYQLQGVRRSATGGTDHWREQSRGGRPLRPAPTVSVGLFLHVDWCLSSQPGAPLHIRYFKSCGANYRAGPAPGLAHVPCQRQFSVC